jgi:hypothetical protein
VKANRTKGKRKKKKTGKKNKKGVGEKRWLAVAQPQRTSHSACCGGQSVER